MYILGVGRYNIIRKICEKTERGFVMKKRILALFVTAAMAFSLAANVLTVFAADSTTVVRLDPREASPFNGGKFQGWGTALCWWANRLGYSEKLTEQAADAFFSDEGLGLDIARYNLGGGDDPTHTHVNRSDSKVPGVWETFKLSDDGKDVEKITYDITNDQNQLNIAKAALKANPDLYFEGFSNSAPYFMTITGCTSGGTASTRINRKGETETYSNENNLKDDFYDDFAKFIADATLLFKKEGIVFRSYSPMNEPDTDYWFDHSGKQEGCHFDPGEKQSKMIVETRKALDAAGLNDVLVAGMDETSLKKTANNLGSLTTEAKEALGRVDTHTYSDRGYHAQVKAKALELKKNLWQSEVDKGGSGLTLAEMIIEDVNGMQPSAWVMWDIVDFHKDSKVFQYPAGSGNFPEANHSVTDTTELWGVGMADHDNEKLILTNKYYAYGQFTKYINPGDTIIASSNSTLAAYNRESGDIKIVALNSTASDKPYVFDLGAFTNVGNQVDVIRTNNLAGSSAEHWAKITEGTTLADKKITTTLKAGTVTTFVVEGNEGAATNYISVSGADRVSIGAEAAYSFTSDIDDAQTAAWSTNDTSVATIDETGKLTALKKGTVTVTATVGEVTGTRDVEVYFEITGVGDKLKLGSEVQLSAGSLEGVTWSSDNPTVVSITDAGVVKALAPGEATITATYGGDTATKTIVVPSYILTGTPSWSDEKNAPKDKDDYTQVADGNLETYFDGTTGGWVQYDFGAPYSVSKIKLAARSGNGMPERTIGGRVQGSSDAINWTDLYKVTSALPTSYKEIAASELTNLKAYRYYRYTNTEKMANIAEFLIEGEPAGATPDGEPVVEAIDEFTDDFESSVNIFRAAQSSSYDTTGNAVFPSGLARFGKVFAPIKDKAVSTLSEPIELNDKNIFRLSFNMFSGWEDGGKTNTFAINDENGHELVALEITGGGYTLEAIRINGENALTKSDVRAQCRASVSKGANGWNVSGQSYANNVGYNKTVEITIDGLGQVKVSFTGGLADTEVSGNLAAPVTIGSISAEGDYNASANRIVTYDNFVGDLITYVNAIEPEPEPVETPAPVLPSNNELIHLKLDNNLDSTSSYGKAEGVGTPAYETLDGRTALKLSNNNNTAIKLTDSNGNPLLTGQEEITIAFKVKPTSSDTSWWFYAAPNDSAQTYNSEKYIGALTNGGNIKVERYNNSGTRSDAAEGACAANQWNNVVIQHKSDETIVYVNGQAVSTVASTVNISNMLGNSSVAYIGKANWGSGEYAAGYIDDFVIYKGIVDVSGLYLGDLSAVKTDIDLPTSLDDGSAVTWASSNTDIISNTGKVTRPDLTTDVTLTATVTPENDEAYTSQFTATVIGLAAVSDTFTAYNDNGDIKYTSDYDADDTPYDMYVALHTSDGTLISVTKNQKDGSFTDLAEGTYKVSCYIWGEKNEPKHNVVTKTVKAAKETEMGAYLFAHFVGSEGKATDEQIYFSASENGTDWEILNSGSPVLTSTVGTTGMRDPYIMRLEDGSFVIIATDLSIFELNKTQGGNKWGYSQTNGSDKIVVWKSNDLVNWTGPNAISIGPAGAGCVWAPEAVYDREEGKYMVFWASKVSSDNYAKQRIYRSYTTDFETFTTPEVYIDHPNSTIDTTFIEDKGVYYRFTKDESHSAIDMMRSTSLSGTWTEMTNYTLDGKAGTSYTGYEGPTIYKLNGENKWCYLIDLYSKSKGYFPFITSDLSSGTFTSPSEFSFPNNVTYRHGTVMPITTEEYNKIKAKWGNN